jgi:hypothetical protein
VLAVAGRRPRWGRRSTIDVTELANEPLLVLSKEFGSRQLFDAACRLAQVGRKSCSKAASRIP